MLKVLLYPFSIIYGLIIFIRNWLYDTGILKSADFNIPVISIGNITVGGTGKTPHVEYLINLLKDKFAVASLSRGYKRKTKGFRRVETDSTVAEAGDEPLQIKKKFPGITVSVCENRVRGLEQLFSSEDEIIPDVVLLDDAFQHRRIYPGINILLIDYNRPLKDDWLLPAGRLREGAAQVRRANIIIFTKCPPEELTPIKRRILQKEVNLRPYQELFFTTYHYENIKSVFYENEVEENFYLLRDYAILIVTGIAFPRLIPDYLKQFASETQILSFPDHHKYSSGDIQVIMSKFDSINKNLKIIVTTEKDAVRFIDMKDLDEDFKKALYYLPVKVKFLNEERRSFDKKILNYVGENKSNREVYKRQVKNKF
ncbi:MAG: tetraacyldisaccharide 4'-kinase [Prolixibacteraceae bacterium]|nr:tetraacyldisaccharide 4'-kinase [Prolixibacteraceae bacterium]